MLAALAVMLTRVVNLEDLTGSIAGPIEIPPPVATTDQFIDNLPQDGSFWRNYIHGGTFDVHPELPMRDESITRSERQFETDALKAITTTASNDNDDDNVWDNEDSSSTFAYAGEQGNYILPTQEQIARIEASKKKAAQLRAANRAANPPTDIVPFGIAVGDLTREQVARIEASKKKAAQLREQQKRALPLQSSPISIKKPRTQASLDSNNVLDSSLDSSMDSSSTTVVLGSRTMNGHGIPFLFEDEGMDPSTFATILPTSESSGNQESRELLAVSSLSEVGRVSVGKAKSMLRYNNLEDATQGLLSRGAALNRLEKVYVEIRKYLGLCTAKMVRHDVNHRAGHDPKHKVATVCDFHYPAPDDKVLVHPITGFGTSATLRFSEANFRHARTREARHWLGIEDAAELDEVVQNAIDRDARHARMFSISNDLWPYPEELGFDFLKDVWQKIPQHLQEDLAAAQSMSLASFNFGEIVAGRTEIRHYTGGRNPRDFWPQWIIDSERITNTVLAFFHPHRDPFRVSFGVGPHLIAATYGGLGIEEAEQADMALSYVFEEQLHGGILQLNRALSDGLTSAQHAARLTDWLAASENWRGPWLLNGDPFTDEEKTAYEALVLTARKKLGHKGHTEAVRRIAVALGIDEDQAASVLGRRGRAVAVRRIAMALGIDLNQAASELGRRGHAGAVRRIAMALGIDLNQAASVLGQRGHSGAVRRIAAALGIDLDQAASELGRRGGNGSSATLEGMATGTHVSKGKEPTSPKERVKHQRED